MKEVVILDLTSLPPHGQGTASETWWGTIAFMLIEGTGFAVAIAVYLYLMSLAPSWPPDAPPPDLLVGSVLTAILLVSLVPNVLISRWAREQSLKKVRLGLIVMAAFGVTPLALRIFEFPSLNISWDANAYGSIAWVLLGLHTTHVLTDVVETLVIACLMFTRHGMLGRRFGDVSDNAMYWNFVVITWLPIYLCIYWVPRL